MFNKIKINSDFLYFTLILYLLFGAKESIIITLSYFMIILVHEIGHLLSGIIVSNAVIDEVSISFLKNSYVKFKKEYATKESFKKEAPIIYMSGPGLGILFSLIFLMVGPYLGFSKPLCQFYGLFVFITNHQQLIPIYNEDNYSDGTMIVRILFGQDELSFYIFKLIAIISLSPLMLFFTNSYHILNYTLVLSVFYMFEHYKKRG